jgi:hypothetical protein
MSKYQIMLGQVLCELAKGKRIVIAAATEATKDRWERDLEHIGGDWTVVVPKPSGFVSVGDPVFFDGPADTPEGAWDFEPLRKP